MELLVQLRAGGTGTKDWDGATASRQKEGTKEMGRLDCGKQWDQENRLIQSVETRVRGRVEAGSTLQSETSRYVPLEKYTD